MTHTNVASGEIMYHLCELGGVWLLLKNMTPILSSRKTQIFNSNGELISEGVKMREYVRQHMPEVPEGRLPSPKGFYLNEAKVLVQYLQNLPPAPAPIAPPEALQKPVIVQATSQEDLDSFHEILRAVCQARGYVVFETHYGTTSVVGPDDFGQECRANVKDLEIVPASSPGTKTRSRNRWFAEHIKRLMADKAREELQALEEAERTEAQA